MLIKVRNLAQFTTRRRGEIKLSESILRDHRLLALAPAVKWRLVELMLAAASSGNRLHLDDEDGVPEQLLDAGFLEVIPEENRTQKLADQRASRYIAEDVKKTVMLRDGFQCKRCGRKDDLNFDHIVPHSRGGDSSEENIQLLCGRCNRRKANNHRGSL